MTRPDPFAYAELDCLSNFSFQRGASHPEELVDRAAALGYHALALADHCSLAGLVRAWQQAREHGLKLIAGSRFTLAGHQLIVLATNLQGYGNLSEFITLIHDQPGRQGTEYPQAWLQPGNMPLPHLSGLPHCLAILRPPHGSPSETTGRLLQPLQALFANRLWLGLARRQHAIDAEHTQQLRQLSQQHGVPLVALGHAEMHQRSRQPLHDALTALRLKKPVTECGHALYPNAEHHLRSRQRLHRLFPADALRETLHIANQCTFDLSQIRYEYPREIVPEGHTAASWLRHETLAGARRRFPQGVAARVQSQLESELAIIASLAYEPYFLTVYDIVQFARRQGILCQGRGSAANSAVCYCLGITEVSPADGNTLFARFISHARKEPPDIDVDFEHQRREEVMQYIFRKYGRQRAALAAVVITYRSRSALRDSGRALGLPPTLVNQVAKSHHPLLGSRSLAEHIASHGLAPNNRLARLWATLAGLLKGFPRHLSQHPGGFVISHSPLNRLVPIENAAMPGRRVVQWDKDDLDALDLMKVDVLALGMLSALRRSLEFVALRRGRPFGLHDIPAHDDATFAMTRQADTMGVFQIESRAQMSMLPRLKPQCFYDLVVQVAIVRPGPIQGGMVHPYLRRRMGQEPAVCPFPPVQRVLERTLGVPIFQEQAMQIAIEAAGFSAEDADALRRSMAAWRRRGGVNAFRERLIEGMRANGCPPDFAQAIVNQLEGFGEYGFPESHAASFAKLAYFSAWLKCHEPEAFLAALLNSQPMGFYSPSQLVQDARRHGVQVLPVNVQHSHWQASLEPGDPAMSRPAVRLGLNQIKGFEEASAQQIVQARQAGPFHGLNNFLERTGLNRRQQQLLAAANALQGLAGTRPQASWQVALPRHSGLLQAAPIIEDTRVTLPQPTEGHEILADYRSLGLTLGRHPLALLRSSLNEKRFSQAAWLLEHCPNRRLVRACGIVTTRQRPQTSKGTVFVTLEDETGHVNVIVHRHMAERQPYELTQARLMGVYGVWQRQHGVCHLLASRLVDLTHLLGNLPTQSRNFH